MAPSHWPELLEADGRSEEKMANQASMVRRQRERARQQKRREKHARKTERREAKKAEDAIKIPDNPMEDPTIDWGSAVHETEVVLNDNLEVVEDEPEESGESEDAEVAATASEAG